MMTGRDVPTEIAEIEATMRSDIGSYWGDAGMQTRYRDLLEARDGPQDVVEHSGGELIRMPSVSSWRRAGRKPEQFSQFLGLVKRINDVLVQMSGPDAKLLKEGFDRLSEATQGAVCQMLLDRRTIVAAPFTQEAVDDLSGRDPAMKALHSEWDNEAPLRFAILQKRLLTALALCGSNIEADRLGDWFLGLPVTARVGVSRVLGRDRV